MLLRVGAFLGVAALALSLLGLHIMINPEPGLIGPGDTKETLLEPALLPWLEKR